MKRGEMTITTIIAIVLAVAILVFLIYGFSTGWGNFWSKVNIFGGGKTNINEIAQACLMACQNQDTYRFCNEEREIIKEDGSKLKLEVIDEYKHKKEDIKKRIDEYTLLDKDEKKDYDPIYIKVKVTCNSLATDNRFELTNIFEECPGLC